MPPAALGARSGDLRVSLNGVDYTPPIPFLYYDEPRLVSVALLGKPIAGRTAVTLHADAPLPFVDWQLAPRLRRRDGDARPHRRRAGRPRSTDPPTVDGGVGAEAPTASGTASCA